jgi:hypothetical protein
MPIHMPARAVYEYSCLMYGSSDAGDEVFHPYVTPIHGWDVQYPDVIGEHGVRLWPALIKCDLYVLGLSHLWRSHESVLADGVEKLQRTIHNAVTAREQCRWWQRVQAAPILRTYRQLKLPNTLQMEEYLQVSHRGWNDAVRLGQLALTRIRCGKNELMINIGRYQRPVVPATERFCRMCEGEHVEAEQHFLLHCDYYHEQRLELYSAITLTITHQYTDSEPSMIPAVVNEFDMYTQPVSSQLLIMCGGTHVCMKKKWCQQKVRVLVMKAIHAWLVVRKKILAHMDEHEQSSDESDEEIM